MAIEQDTVDTVVVFRKFKDVGSIIALFPFELADTKGNCSSYMHVGQHGAADYAGCIRASVPATEAEYLPLKRELESIGYKLRVRTRKGA
jgi:hypothetical protein